MYTVVGGSSLCAPFLSVASCQLTPLVTNQDFRKETNPCPTLFRIVPCHKLDVHAGLLCQDFFSFVKFVGFVEPVNFVFSGGKNDQTWKQGAQYKHSMAPS